MSKAIVEDYFSQLRESIKEWFKFAKTPKGKQYSKKQKWSLKAKIAQGYILESNGIYYKEQDVLDGKCPLNGTLYHRGYRQNDDGTWYKV